MSRPPIRAFEAVKRYCQKKQVCKDCPLYDLKDKYYKCGCSSRLPCDWILKKEGEEK